MMPCAAVNMLDFALCCLLQEFNLIDRKELVPLQELIEKLTTKDR